jgi:RNA polymerase sigma-70 factor (ECF subfamily)
MAIVKRGDIEEISEQCLVRQAVTGDSRAFELLYRRYHPYVAKIIADSVADVDARLDLQQTTFERAWRRLDTLADHGAFRPWIAQIARRLIIDHFRLASRTVQTDFDNDRAAEVASDDWTADDWASMRELAEALDVAVEGLSARDATVLDLATTFGFGAPEIAAALDIEAGHARVLLHRARRRLSAAVYEQSGLTIGQE